MKLILIHTGKTKPDYIDTGCREYYTRIRKYLSFQEILLKDIRKSGNMTIEDHKKKEGDQLLKIIQPSDFLVLFDRTGTSYSSESFAQYLEKLFMTGKALVFVTGGAYGFSEDVYKRSNYMISLSEMTYSHQMVRLLVAEQLYRALTIINGGPYHHA